MDDEDEEWNNDEDDQPQGYQALLDPDDEEFRTSTNEQDEEEEEEDEIKSIEEEEEEEARVDDGQIKPFSCPLCSSSFSKFEGYREHFVSAEHRYKRRDEKKRLGVCFIIILSIKISFSIIILKEGCIIESSPVEVFVNLLLYNKVSKS